MWQDIIVFICIVAIPIELLLKPRIETTRNKDVLLFYNSSPLTRNYIKLFRL